MYSRNTGNNMFKHKVVSVSGIISGSGIKLFDYNWAFNKTKIENFIQIWKQHHTLNEFIIISNHFYQTCTVLNNRSWS